MAGWSETISRASGKWQLPLLALSLILLSTSLLLLRPDPGRMPLDRAAATLRMFRDAGDFARAIEIGQDVLNRPDCTPVDRAAFHLELARTRFAAALAQAPHIPPALADAIVDHYRNTEALGDAGLEPQDFSRLGRALEWTRQYRQAVEVYTEGLSRGLSPRMPLQKHVIELLRDELENPAGELDAELDRFLSDLGGDEPELLDWALEEKIGLLAELGRAPEAFQLVESAGDALPENRLEYLRALSSYAAGQYETVEVALRALRNRLEPEDPLVAQSGWLLGRTVLNLDRPQAAEEALSFFREVLAKHPRGLYAVASRLGVADALARMGEHENALEAYRAVLEDLFGLDRNRLVSKDAIRAGLSIQAEALRAGRDLPAALQYARLAAELVEPQEREQAIAHVQQVAAIEAQLAQQLRDGAAAVGSGATIDASVPHSWRELLVESATNFRRLSDLEVHNESRSADAAWRAAELFAEAGHRRMAIAEYERFARTRPQSALVPRALLRIGQLHQAGGDHQHAIAAFEECYRSFPTILDGIRSLVPLARSYAALSGDEMLAHAEKMLRIVLQESDVFTPQAPEFADALFLLGDVLERREQYEQAASVLHESLDRYPGDPRLWRTRFLLAGCYRQSGLNLKREAAAARFEGEIEQIRAESRTRLAKAGGLYRELIDEFESRRTGNLNRLEQVYLRHAYMYEADCRFEGGEHREALKRYEEAAGLYKDSPTSLAAYVQMIHCHVFLGEPRQARTVLARAKVVLDRMESVAFTAGVSPETKADWQQYFEWLNDSELF